MRQKQIQNGYLMRLICTSVLALMGGWTAPVAGQNISSTIPNSVLQPPPAEISQDSTFASQSNLRSGSSLEGQRIARIDLEVQFSNGSPATDNGLRDLLNVRAGEEYSPVIIHQALHRIHQSGRASNAQVFLIKGDIAGTVVLRFVITRQERVKDIFFNGNQFFSPEELRARLVGLDVNAPLSKRAVEDGQRTVLNVFQEKGFFQAKIDWTISGPDVDGRVDITYRILQGDQALLAKPLQIEGDVKVELKKLTEKLKSKPGIPYTTDLVQSDLEKIRQWHLDANYLNPQISLPFADYDPGTNAVTVSVNVGSGPLVDLKIEGYDLSRKEQEKVLPILRYGGLDDFVLEDGKRKMLTYLQTQGYFFAAVDYTKSVFEEKAEVVYTVEKDRRYRLEVIKLLGTDEFTMIEIGPELLSQPAGILPRSRGKTSLESLTTDSTLIERKLRNLGYLQARVTERRLGILPDKPDFEVTFVVDEGQRTLVKEVAFIGNTTFTSDRLQMELLQRAPDDNYFSQERLNQDINQLYGLYEEAGYARAVITPKIEFADNAPNEAKVTYQIEEGKRIFINDVFVTVRGRTHKHIVQKYLLYQKGNLLQQSKLSQTEQNLYATGLFNQVVTRIQPVRSDGPYRDLYDVFIDVAEGKRYTLSYSVGIEQQEVQRQATPRFSFEIANRNLLGRLQTASLIFRLSQREQLGQVSYQFPHFFGSQWPFLTTYLFQRAQEVSFSIERKSVQLRTERKLNDLTSLIFRYQFDDVRPFDLEISGDDLDRNNRPVKLGRISSTYLRDSRDSALDATKGSFSIIDLSLASTKLGGTERYLRLFGQYQQFRAVPKIPSVTFASSIRIGLARPYGESTNLPISERFFTGGANTIRGLDFEQAGPRDPITDQPIGGNAVVVLNAELRYPIFRALTGAAFYDTGNVFDKVSNIRLGGFTNTIGTGIRLKTGLGPIRVDLGYNLDPPSYVAVPNQKLSRLQIHFSFGQAF
ncbi:MAG: BamA/TamA family outer membrane protein [Acidobacteria bacterium]|nr:BamA/TamA family outer membrane protein [Acidobacteriota bacterium]